MYEKSDPGRKKTRDYLCDALINLMSVKKVHTITVQELTEKAYFKKSTFYLHYRDMPDFLNDVIDEMLYGLMERISDPERQLGIFTKKNNESYYEQLFEYIGENAAFFKIMLSAQGLPEFRHKLCLMGKEQYLESLQPLRKEIEAEIALPILVNYVISAHIGLVEYWLNSNMQYSAAFMAKQITHLTFSGPLRIANPGNKIELP